MVKCNADGDKLVVSEATAYLLSLASFPVFYDEGGNEPLPENDTAYLLSHASFPKFGRA